MPLVSVCIPTYNQLNNFKNALNSVFIQEFNDYEIIVTDDSSNDEIYNFLKSNDYLNRVHYLKNNQSLGSPLNWNRAISLSSGDFIKILHHDDQFLDERSLGKFVDALLCKPEIDMVFCVVQNQDAKTGLRSINCPSAEELQALTINPSVLFCGNFIGPPSAILFRSPNKYLFNKKLKWLVDIDFYIQNWPGNRIHFIPEALINVSCGGVGQVTRLCENDQDIHLFEYFTVFDALQSSLTKDMREKCIRHLKIILSRFNIQSPEAIQEAGYFGAIPKEILQFIPWIRFNQVIAKCIAKL
jgi:glycosyltransferase involved in cell wall biosynthesis